MKPSVRKLTHCGLMLALAFVLSNFKIMELYNGGAVTIASMAPIIIISFMYGSKTGVFTAFVYSLLQMVQGFYPPPVQNVWNFILVILLDYVIAFSALGLANLFKKPFGDKKVLGSVVATLAVVFIRFFCHFISGIVIWAPYAPEGMGAALYSFLYNGSVMIGEMITTGIVVGLLVKFVDFDKITKKINA